MEILDYDFERVLEVVIEKWREKMSIIKVLFVGVEGLLLINFYSGIYWIMVNF